MLTDADGCTSVDDAGLGSADFDGAASRAARPSAHLEQGLGLWVSPVRSLVLLMDNVEMARFKVRTVAITSDVHRLSGDTSRGRCVTDNSNALWLRVELSCAHFDFTLSS